MVHLTVFFIPAPRTCRKAITICHHPLSCADKAIGDVQVACEEAGFVMLVTADHGNAERMIDEQGKPVTKHTTYRGIEGGDAPVTPHTEVYREGMPLLLAQV